MYVRKTVTFKGKRYKFNNIPSGLTVKGDLDLSKKAKAFTLPSDLTIEGDLYLSLSDVTALSSGLTVKGNLYLGWCSKLVSLPHDLVVMGDLDISWCYGLQYIPASIQVGGKIYNPLGIQFGGLISVLFLGEE